MNSYKLDNLFQGALQRSRKGSCNCGSDRPIKSTKLQQNVLLWSLQLPRVICWQRNLPKRGKVQVKIEFLRFFNFKLSFRVESSFSMKLAVKQSSFTLKQALIPTSLKTWSRPQTLSFSFLLDLSYEQDSLECFCLQRKYVTLLYSLNLHQPLTHHIYLSSKRWKLSVRNTFWSSCRSC